METLGMKIPHGCVRKTPEYVNQEPNIRFKSKSSVWGCRQGWCLFDLTVALSCGRRKRSLSVAEAVIGRTSRGADVRGLTSDETWVKQKKKREVTRDRVLLLPRASIPPPALALRLHAWKAQLTFSTRKHCSRTACCALYAHVIAQGHWLRACAHSPAHPPLPSLPALPVVRATRNRRLWPCSDFRRHLQLLPLPRPLFPVLHTRKTRTLPFHQRKIHSLATSPQDL
jgi:hypothetical protein